MFGVLLASFALALAISSALQKKIVGPLLRLASTAKTIASEHDYSVRAVVRGGDEIGTLSAAFNDMLQQIGAQNATLQESESNFRELADAMPQIVWTSRALQEAQYVNQRWFEYTGVTAGAAEEFGWPDVTHPDDQQAYLDARATSSQLGLPFATELRIRRASDGAYRWHLARALPVRDKDGQITRWFGTYTDIDDQKTAEAEIRKVNAELERRVLERTEKLTIANAELAKASEAKDRFLATMSHELRTPLNAILGFTGTLLMKLPGPLTTEQEDQLQTVRASARHLLSLINDLLDLAKIESGKIVLKFEPVNCRTVINDVATALAPLAKAKGLRFEVVLPDQDVVLPTDSRALSQIVINLTNNAIKFTEKGFVRLELKKLAGGSPRVELSVVDSGIGISKDDQERLFQAFEQGRANANRFEGTGLGLHLSQKLAVLLGGQIIYQSEHGAGSRFSLAL
jgi:PAS domain S-box-containing protein